MPDTRKTRDALAPVGISPATRSLALRKLAESGLLEEDAVALKLNFFDDARTINEKFEPRPCIMIPYYAPEGTTPLLMPDGTRLFYQIRYLGPPTGFKAQTLDGDQRYDQEKDSGTHAYFCPAVRWTERKIEAITEGAWKAAASCSRGVATVALQGVDCFHVTGDPRSLLPELDRASYADVVTLIFDRDPRSKPHARVNVARALGRLQQALAAKGIKTRIKQLPALDGDQKVGLDDFIVSFARKVRKGDGRELYRQWFYSEDDVVDGPEVFVAPMQPIDEWWYLATSDSYYNLKSRHFVGAKGLNATCRSETRESGDLVPASELAKQHRVDGLTWYPEDRPIVRGRFVDEGGWGEKIDHTTLNTYRPPPALDGGDPRKAGPWLELVERLYNSAGEHLIKWFAAKAQRPEVKIQHALVLGGAQGIGKDTMLAPVIHTLGGYNVQNVSPSTIAGDFNGWLKCVMLVIDEAADVGADERAQVDKRRFYEKMKTLIASTATGTLLVNEKFKSPYRIFNVLGVVYTTNHQIGAIYLPPDDRRHYVAWSSVRKEALPAGYHASVWKWYAQGGTAHVAAYLRTLDLSQFEPEAPPPQTQAWQQMVAHETPAGDAELMDALEALDGPDAVAIPQLFMAGSPELRGQLGKSKYVASALLRAGYVKVLGTSTGGRWAAGPRKVPLYAREALTLKQREAACKELVKRLVKEWQK